MNLAAKIKSFREQSRERFLQPEEVPKFFRSLERESQLFQDFFMMLLMTGARRSNVQAMQWSDVSLDTRTWRVRGETTKNGAPLTINLAKKAVEILSARFGDKADSPYVFATHSKSGHLVETKSAWKRVINRAGLKDLRPHDLRRTLGSWLAIGGFSLPMIGAALGHKSVQSTTVYARLTQQPVIDAVAKATDALLLAADPASASNNEGRQTPRKRRDRKSNDKPR